MRKTRILLCVTLLSITLGTGSCVILQDADLLAPIAALTRHEKLVVSAPSWAGAVVGGIAGLPLAIIALPVTLPLAVAEGGMMTVLPFTPILVTAEIGAILLGGPVWLVAGWW